MTIVVPPAYANARTLAAGLYEPSVARLFENILGEGMTMVDLGANIGYYTLLASRLVGRSGRVYAFEPDPENHQYLLRNIVANGCRNVTVVEKAVYNITGTMTFLRDPHGAAGFLVQRERERENTLIILSLSRQSRWMISL